MAPLFAAMCGATLPLVGLNLLCCARDSDYHVDEGQVLGCGRMEHG